MSKPWKWFVILAAGLLLCGTAWLVFREREPERDGQPLRHWLAQYHESSSMESRTEAVAAIREIGTNALPWLVSWTRYEPGPLLRWAQQNFGKLPRPLQTSGFAQRHLLSPPADELSMWAGGGFEVLGRNASPVIPQLVNITKDHKRLYAATRALYALAAVGETALPDILALAADPTEVQSFTAINMITVMHEHGTDVSPARACLERLRQATNLAMRMEASNTLYRIAPMEYPEPPNGVRYPALDTK